MSGNRRTRRRRRGIVGTLVQMAICQLLALVVVMGAHADHAAVRPVAGVTADPAANGQWEP